MRGGTMPIRAHTYPRVLQDPGVLEEWRNKDYLSSGASAYGLRA